VTKDLDLDAMAEEFALGVPDNNVPPANIALYIKEAKTPKEAVEHVHEVTAKVENAVEQKREESGVNIVLAALMRIWSTVSKAQDSQSI
jgi:hypothetical protein